MKAFLDLIKFEHTIFALPFAYLGMLLAARGWPGWEKFIWITVAMAAARTFAMAFNRIADSWWDARNPRTAQRPLVTGKISMRAAWTGTLASLLILIIAAWQLNLLALILLPGALLFLVGYSYTKRFTSLSHFILGFTDGLAPTGAWVAVTGSLFQATDLPAYLLTGAVTLWIGGFDLLYACQDIAFDRQYHLHSVPAERGILFALQLSSISHMLVLLLLVILGLYSRLAWPYFGSLVVTIGLLVWEHRLVKPEDLSKINQAFFNINSYIALTLFAGVLLGLIF